MLLVGYEDLAAASMNGRSVWPTASGGEGVEDGGLRMQ